MMKKYILTLAISIGFFSTMEASSSKEFEHTKTSKGVIIYEYGKIVSPKIMARTKVENTPPLDSNKKVTIISKSPRIQINRENMPSFERSYIHSSFKDESVLEKTSKVPKKKNKDPKKVAKNEIKRSSDTEDTDHSTIFKFDFEENENDQHITDSNSLKNHKKNKFQNFGPNEEN